VCFEYPTRPGVQVLKNFSLDIAPGQVVGFTGRNGSGKSTLALLLQG
jgi:ABC-type multidrug transport system fused ATPase/permease subunit